MVPKLTNHTHLETILPIIDETLNRTQITRKSINYITITQKPGLIKTLIIKIHTTKALTYTLKKKLINIHHIKTHLTTMHLWNKKNPNPTNLLYPHINLTINKNHTTLYQIHGTKNIHPLNQTLNNATKKTYNKITTILNLNYPKKKRIDDLTKKNNPDTITFPHT